MINSLNQYYDGHRHNLESWETNGYTYSTFGPGKNFKVKSFYEMASYDWRHDSKKVMNQCRVRTKAQQDAADGKGYYVDPQAGLTEDRIGGRNGRTTYSEWLA